MPAHLTQDLDLSAEAQARVLAEAQALKADRGRHRDTAKGLCLGMIFDKSSTRTRVSFEVGMHQMGGHALFLQSRDSQMGRGEPLADTAQVLSRYVDILSIRTHAHKTTQELARYAQVPVINALDDMWHPCQALADLQTLKEHHTALAGLQLVYVGDGNNMAHSLLAAGALAGMHVRIICPDGYAPKDAVWARLGPVAQASGSRLERTDALMDGVQGADVVYTDVWTSMGQEAQNAKRLADFQGYTVSPAVMAQARSEAIFLHCLPAHRGQEVDARVIDGPQAKVFDQAENRLHAQKALILHLLNRL
jgi:ornithine carbamoyltransferase